MKIETMKDAFVLELSDIHSAEKQLAKALPKMASAATDERLTQAIEKHQQETEQQIEKVEKAAALCKVKIKRKKCEAMAGLIDESTEIMRNVEAGPVCDAMLIAAAQKVEHYEIASYGCLVTYAKQLGFNEAAALLQEILEEEKRTDEALNELALQGINDEALEQETTQPKDQRQKGNTMSSRNQYSGRGGNNMPERDEEGRFMSGNRGSSRNQNDYNDDNNYQSSRGRSSNYDYEDDRRYDNRGRNGGGNGGQGGWFGDSEGHSEAARRGWENPDHGPSGWYGDSRGHSEASRRGWDNPDHGPSGWFGDSEGHAEAGRHSHDNDRGGRSQNYNSRSDNRYSDDYNDNRSYRSQGGGRGNDRSQGSGQGRGWFGDPQGHAEAGRQSHGGRGGNYGGRR